MEEVKPWYLSRTIWASVVVIVTSIAGLFGFTFDDAEMTELVDGIMQAVVAVAALVALIGRLAARARIG